MNITLVVNANKPDSCRYAESIRQYLEAREVHVKALYGAYTRDDFTDADAIISIGGDGTMLRLAGVLRGQDTPLLGVNAGHLGYLTQVSEASQIPDALDRLLAHDYTRDVRAMLHGSVRRNDEVISRGTALNEILISRCEGISVLRFTVLCDGEELSHYTADGILFATPTGSTAYGLSAGGPVIEPSAENLAVIPICAHALAAKSFVFAPERTLAITAACEGGSEVFISADGGQGFAVRPDDRVLITRSALRTRLIRLKGNSFYRILQQKL